MLVGERLVQLGVAALVEVAIVEPERQRLQRQLRVQRQFQDQRGHMTPATLKQLTE